MRIGIVSDIHCNLYGLEKALEVMGDIDQLFCLGDVVSATRFSNELVGRLREIGGPMVLGNHDHDYLDRVAEKEIAKGVTDPDLVAWMRGLPETLEFEFGGKKLLMTHATPWTRDYVHPGSMAMRKFAQVDADWVLGGHTHGPFVGRIGRPLVINPGSAGEAIWRPPAPPQLSCAVLDTEADEAWLVDYPPQPDA